MADCSYCLGQDDGRTGCIKIATSNDGDAANGEVRHCKIAGSLRSELNPAAHHAAVHTGRYTERSRFRAATARRVEKRSMRNSETLTPHHINTDPKGYKDSRNEQRDTLVDA